MMEKIPVSENTRQPITKNIIEFEMVFDVDIGIVRTMYDKVSNKKLLSPRLLNCASDSAIRNLLLFRENKNPLSVVLNDEYQDSIDTILGELYESSEDEILENTVANSITNLVYNLTNSKAIHNTVLCKNKKQVDLVKKFIPRITTITEAQDMTNYQCIFVKYIDDLLKFREISGKRIYLYNARFNLTDKFSLPPLAIYLSKANTFGTIDPYKDLRVPNVKDNKEKENKNASNKSKTKSDV